MNIINFVLEIKFYYGLWFHKIKIRLMIKVFQELRVVEHKILKSNYLSFGDRKCIPMRKRGSMIEPRKEKKEESGIS